jgi:CheY-like chemotaxis protein
MARDAARLVLSHIPNLVLSDLMMPEMNGIQLTQQTKEDGRTSHILVILLTAKNESETKLEG